jgi:hypothetical protein
MNGNQMSNDEDFMEQTIDIKTAILRGATLGIIYCLVIIIGAILIYKLL